MDPSALIFVALAVAWAAYLIPKALEHSEEGIRSRTVERFSQGMRVIARREPVGRDRTQLTDPRRGPATPTRAAASAARRRRRVLGVILALNLLALALAAPGVLAWAWLTAPLLLLVAWLVACRLMVKQERAARRPARPARPAAPRPVAAQPAAPVASAPAPPAPVPAAAAPVTEHDLTEEHAVVPPEPAADGTWAPQPVTLPTYVSKPPAPRRSVRTIDLDSTGVWTSGRSESDSRLVRDADAAAKALADAKAAREAKRHLG